MPRPLRTLLVPAALIALVAGGLAPTAAQAAAAPASIPLTAASSTNGSPGFYDVPASLPAQNGAIVKSEPMRLAAQVRTAGITSPLPGTATRLMYRTTDTLGAPAAATGTYIEPTAPWLGTGPRPLVSFAEGTQGQGDACAPSKTLASAIVVDDGAISVGYEIPGIYGLLARGVAVVVTDYIGLGTTDRVHTYAVRLDLGHAVLDAARAAKQVPGTTVTDASRIGLFGYSQGGGAVAAAAELAPSYAPELNLAGAYAGAPPADLFGVLQTADGGLTAAVGYAFNGVLSYYPEAKAALAAELNDAGRAALDGLSRACTVDAALKYRGVTTSQWTTTGESFAQVVARSAAAQKAIADQRIGLLRPTIPVQVLTGTKDDVVQHAQAKQLAADWCAQGVSVTYVPVYQPVKTSLNHIGPAVTRLLPSEQWMIDRLNGRAASSNCAQLAWLP